MPVRQKLVTWLGERFMGAQVWNGLSGECESIPTDTYYDVRGAADAAFCDIVEQVDWPRILIESMSRHAELTDHGVHPEQPGGALVRETCPGCVRAALLVTDRLGNWISDEGPAAAVEEPAKVPGDDWPAVLAGALRHRRAGTSNPPPRSPAPATSN